MCLDKQPYPYIKHFNPHTLLESESIYNHNIRTYITTLYSGQSNHANTPRNAEICLDIARWNGLSKFGYNPIQQSQEGSIMAKYDSISLRNIAVAGHGGTGKTTLCESFLFISGKSDKHGRVDDGSSSLDFEPEEQKRHISISSAINFFEWKKYKVNIIDTPGDSNFLMDTKCSLRIADSVIIVVDAVGGVEFQTERVWNYADELSLPKMVYISRMNRERADFFKTVEDINNRLGKKVTVCYLPIGSEESFKGLVDLANMKALFFDDPKGKPGNVDIPDDLLEDAKAYRETMVEDIAECDETLMDKYLEDGDLSIDDIQDGLKKE